MANPNEDSQSMPQGLHIAPPPADSGGKPLFRIIYAIDIDASSPCEAARNAHEVMTDPTSMSPILDVLDHRGKVTRVDLSETDGADQDTSNAEAGENHAGNVPVVIIAVTGGVADVLLKPVGVRVTILDHDVEGDEPFSTYYDGRPCSISEWPASGKITANEHWPIISQATRVTERPYSRHWKCPECGETVECSYDDLAEVGCPYCADCDVEMRLI